MTRMTHREKTLIIAVAAILWAMIGATGCAPHQGHADPRKHGTAWVEIVQGNDHVAFHRTAPAPFWVEDAWSVKYERPADQTKITVEYKPGAKRSATLWTNITSALFGFLGGLFAR